MTRSPRLRISVANEEPNPEEQPVTSHVCWGIILSFQFLRSSKGGVTREFEGFQNSITLFMRFVHGMASFLAAL